MGIDADTDRSISRLNDRVRKLEEVVERLLKLIEPKKLDWTDAPADSTGSISGHG